MIELNPAEIAFPDPATYSPPDGIMAVGGDLQPARLLFAYQRGIFPWYNEGEDILWWCPDPRFVLFPADLRVSKSMKKILRDGVFTFTQNRCFEEVMRHCGQTQRKGQEGTWISPGMLAAYVALHAAGHAHSYEVWLGQDLVGGFYGVAVGEVFCGESMFSSVSNASKAGFIHFVEGSQYRLIDCQVWSAHLESLGAVLVPKKEFLSHLQPCETI